MMIKNFKTGLNMYTKLENKSTYSYVAYILEYEDLFASAHSFLHNP